MLAGKGHFSLSKFSHVFRGATKLKIVWLLMVILIQTPFYLIA